ncbi:MAG: lysylphosphatidylglycerol synthase domain-containing protein [Alphaproteobacteria bacterium]
MSAATDTASRSDSVNWRWWTKAGLTVAAIALSAFLLHRALSSYSADELAEAVRAVPFIRLALAVLFAAASYACLTLFDALAVRYVGGRIGYPRIALASFISLSLGHNIGFAGLSSGAIRYRFYSRWGLTTEDVAKIILFCGVTVAVGLATLAGAALVLQPDLATETLGLSRDGCIALGAGCLAAVGGYLAMAAAVRQPLRIRRWSFEMPTLRVAMLQVAVGTVNFALVAACLHQALAAVSDIPYAAVASVYVIANVATLVTHVPGGLGVIESVVLHLVPAAQVIGAVLVFRIVYFLLPLALGSAVFAVTETVFRLRR